MKKAGLGHWLMREVDDVVDGEEGEKPRQSNTRTADHGISRDLGHPLEARHRVLHASASTAVEDRIALAWVVFAMCGMLQIALNEP